MKTIRITLLAIKYYAQGDSWSDAWAYAKIIAGGFK